MSSIFNKPLDSLTVDDVNLLIAEGYPEGTHVEYKQELPSKNNKIDPWLKGDSSISEYARNQLLKEIVAFANGVGGYLIIGVEESEVKPARAEALKPIPRCVELAEKLRLQVRDCVSPKLPLFYAEGIVISEENDDGVVVAYVPQSRMAPHRLESTLDCYIRRNDRSEKMTMREIQDLTLQRVRAIDKVNEMFRERQAKFHDLMKSAFSGKDCNGIRVTLIPLSADIWINRVHKNEKVRPIQRSISAYLGDVKIRLDSFNYFSTHLSRPILRGSRYYTDGQSSLTVQEIYKDGVVEYLYLNAILNPPDDRVYPQWILSFAANALLAADQFRIYAGFPDIEYGLEISVAKLSGHWNLAQFNSGRKTFEIENNPLILPRISVGGKEEFTEVLRIVNQDLWDSAGVESPELKVIFPIEDQDV